MFPTLPDLLRQARERIIGNAGEEAILWATYMLYGDPSVNYIKSTEQPDLDEHEIIPSISTQYEEAPVLRGTETVSASSETVPLSKSEARQGIIPENSFESQGLIELSNSFCYKKKCLNCSLGTDVLLN